MKSNFWSRYDAVYKFVYYGILIFLPLQFLISELSEDDPFIQADIIPVKSKVDTLRSFPKATILSSAKIDVKDNSTAMRYWAPRPHTDPLYLSFFFLCAIVIALFFGKFSYENPFTKRILSGLYIGCALIIIFYVVNSLRYDWFSQQVEQFTNGQFTYNKPIPFASPEFWVLLILIRIIRIYKRGLALQSDSDLTV